MEKLIRNIIISVVAVLLLVAAYIAIAVIPGQIEEKNIEELQGQSGDISVMSAAVANVQSVTVTNEMETYTLERTEIGEWGINEYPGMNFDEVSLESAVYDFVNIYAIEEIEAPEVFSEYGLDTPRAKIKTVLKDGDTREFVLGNKVAGGTGDFFMDITNNKAYVISVYMADSILKDVQAYRKTKLASVSSDQVTKLEITNSNGRMVMELEESAYSSEMVMRMTYPKHMDLDENVAVSIFENIQDINVVEYVKDNPSNLTTYGLKNPVLTVEIETLDQTHVLKFGDKKNNSVYAMLDGMDFVFLCGTNLYDACANVTPYSLMNKFVNIVNISDVKSITVEGKGKKHILEISGGNDFYIDGKAALAESFRQTYQSIIGIKGSGLAENNITSQAEYTVEFVYKTGETTSVIYASYDDLNYYVEVNGERGFVTLKKGLDSMMNAVETLAKNPMKKMN